MVVASRAVTEATAYFDENLLSLEHQKLPSMDTEQCDTFHTAE